MYLDRVFGVSIPLSGVIKEEISNLHVGFVTGIWRSQKSALNPSQIGAILKFQAMLCGIFFLPGVPMNQKPTHTISLFHAHFFYFQLLLVLIHSSSSR